jgi:hypothetical protein
MLPYEERLATPVKVLEVTLGGQNVLASHIVTILNALSTSMAMLAVLPPGPMKVLLASAVYLPSADLVVVKFIAPAVVLIVTTTPAAILVPLLGFVTTGMCKLLKTVCVEDGIGFIPP